MAGVCVLGDRAKGTMPHIHGCPGCPHEVVGPAITASANVFINGIPALRSGDLGIHAACCGPNLWKVIQASAGVFINGCAAVRKGDKTLHCGISFGQMIDASGDVFDNSLAGGLLGEGQGQFLTSTGPNVVAIPEGAQPIRDDLGNPIGWAYCGEHDEIGHIYDASGRPVGSFTVPAHANVEPDDSLLNPVELLLFPIGGIEAKGGKLAYQGLKKLLSSVSKKGIRVAKEAIPRSREDLYARLYNKAVKVTHKPPGDGRPGPAPGSPAPDGIKDAAGQVGIGTAKILAKHAFELWKKKHGVP